MASWGLQDLKNVASAQIQNQGGEMSSAMGNQSFGGLSGTSFTCHNPLPGLQSCLQPDMPLNLLITSGLVCLWKRSLPLESSPAGAVFPVCWEPHALLPPGCAQGLAQVHGIPGKWGAQGWHTGTTPPHPKLASPAVSLGWPRGKRWILGADSRAEPGKAGLLCPHVLMRGMRVLGAEVGVSGV